MNAHAMTVKLPGLRNHQPAASFAEASSIYRARVRALEERGEGGARNTPDGIIYDRPGRVVARISYNGKVWFPAPDQTTGTLLFDPYNTTPAPADPEQTHGDRVRAYLDRLDAASRDDLADLYRDAIGTEPDEDDTAADIRQVLADRARERAKEDAEEQADDLDPCPICGGEGCTGDYSDGETCPMAFELGGITPRGVVRSVRAMEGGPGGWLIKPVPGQIVGDFGEEAEATRAAASWNATRRLKVENIEVIPEVLQFVHDFATLTSSRKLREAYTAAGMSPDVPLALLKQAKALAGRLPK